MPRKNKFEYGPRPDGLYYWHLKSTNGEIVCQGEGLSNAEDCLTAFHFICSVNIGNTSVIRRVHRKDPPKRKFKAPRGKMPNHPWP